jgi:hypothetical protein
MAFAGHCGLQLEVSTSLALGADALPRCSTRRLGAVMQVRDARRRGGKTRAAGRSGGAALHVLGRPVRGDALRIRSARSAWSPRAAHRLHRAWARDQLP